MKRLIAIVIILLVSTICSAELQVDKVAHFGVGYMLTDITCELSPKENQTEAKLFGLGATMLLATMKESQDAHWDWQDWTATVLGSVVCISIKF